MANITKIIPFTKLFEGGLSRDQNDSASEHPSPYTYNGSNDWHTNRGITYATFKANADSLSYTDTRNNFIFLPDLIWLKIAKVKFWDLLNLDELNSQAIANLMFSWVWGSGYAWRNRVQKYLADKNIVWNISNVNYISEKLNELIKKQGENLTYTELLSQYKEFYKQIPESKNPKGIYTKGWNRRINELNKLSLTFLKKNTAPIALLLLVFVGVGYYFYKNKLY